ncbi:hypothetical protein EDC39_106104 [Geothermobacter ehrlichii]|uniref:Uncharacterized protein n=1 Tax=Geothermobacter ehrlichii TaxID=213224 RepID=A0A5D3WJW1_9BACT|nr:hypothetical protein [Geothermobacter ehrlichii]TYO98504.1 hypothetical protein EDC39_106104 [Geothermobacter ehrlichii]
MTAHQRHHDWHVILSRLVDDLAALPDTERTWLWQRVGRIEMLQRQLHALFLLAEGEGICRDCRGACCARGLHHLTLPNLLSYLLRSETPPQPDFTATCPLLGVDGCLWPPQRRPFNCVTFLCEAVEERLDEAQRRRFYALERELRACYQEVADRYAGAGLRGIWIAVQRHGLDGLLKAGKEPTT